MNKVYFFGPLAALLLFIGIFSVHQGGLKEREAAKAAAAEAAIQAKLAAEQEGRRAAMAEAVKAAEQRKAERAAREARELAEREVRQAAIDARDKAFREQERFIRHIERAKKDIEAEQAALAKIAAERQLAESEKAFLEDFVAKARANVQALEALLTRVATPAPAAAAAPTK
jgi:colicin import membrane protein